MLSELIDFLGSLHPLIVHLPIGILLMTIGIDFIMRNRNNSTVDKIVTFGWFLSFLSGFWAALFGWFLGDNNYYFESQISIHRWGGIAFVGLCFFVWILRYLNFKYSTTFTHLFNLTAMVLITITGHYGGEMTHGQNYLINNLPFVTQEKTTHISEEKRAAVDSLFVFEDLVYPVLEEKCMACHNQKQSYGGLNMTSFEALLKGGNSGVGIQKGMPYKSLIYKRVSFPQDHPKFMPPAGVPLSYDQIATLEWWIDNGAEKQIPVTAVRKDPKIQRLMELQYGLDLREKSYLETLTLTPPAPSDLEAINGEKFSWRFINPEESFLDVKFTQKKIENADLVNIQQVKNNVTWLTLTDCRLTDNQLIYLANFPNLTRLKLQKNPMVTNKGIEALRALENLNQLNLYGTRINDAVFATLGQMKNLKKLFLWNTRVTPAGIESFKAQHPEVEIIAGL
jgi:uncharacterized membrane protein